MCDRKPVQQCILPVLRTGGRVPRSSRMERVYICNTKMYSRTSAYICCPPNTIREHGSEQPIDKFWMHRNNVTHVDGLASTSHDHPFYANAREIVLAEGPCSPLSDGVIQLGGFHLLLSSWMGSTGTIVAGNGTNAFSIGTSINNFERDNRRRTVLFT